MKLTVLVDNNTMTDLYFSAEPGFSLFCEWETFSGLFDVGDSGCFLRNAQKAGIDGCNCDFIAFSHGHADHTWGLSHLLSHRFEQMVNGKTLRSPVFYAHPDVFLSRTAHGLPEVGILIPRERLEVHGTVITSRKPVFIRDDLVFLGEVPREAGDDASGESGERYIRKAGELAEDRLADDTALVWRGENGLVIMTGCSHAGICAIVEYACTVCGDDRVQDIIGGFHLYRTPSARVREIGATLAARRITTVHPCHCTGSEARAILSGFLDVQETGAGMALHYD
jgi:7,8-dihydropterin-6-yl-methyl-4-(beta-D-ribofuranosyl)aminobenzene 5'-phosphate synthase